MVEDYYAQWREDGYELMMGQWGCTPTEEDMRTVMGATQRMIKGAKGHNQGSTMDGVKEATKEGTDGTAAAKTMAMMRRSRRPATLRRLR